MYEPHCYPIPIDHRPHDPCYLHPDTHITPPPEAETQVHCFREPTQEEENHKIEALMGCMHGLSVHDESYVELYAWCARRFPNIAQILPKPVFAQHVPAPVPAAIVAFSHHTPVPPPPPARQLQAVTADPPPSVGNHVPSAHIKSSDSDEDYPFHIFAAKKKLKVKRSAMPESQPSALVFATATPSASVSIVSPTSVPAAPASLASSAASATTAPTPSTPVVASFPIVPALPSTIIASVPAAVTPSAPVIAVSPAEIVATLPPMPVYASVMPAATTLIISPAP